MRFDPTIIKNGGMIAYPTEAVYGLGCDPFNQQAVQRLLKIKQRPEHKGFILIVSTWAQMQALVQLPEAKILAKVKATWPGPVTWLFPASPDLPPWINGGQTSVAIRMTNHPIAKSICDSIDQALISTSANLFGQAALTTCEQVQKTFGDQIDYIVSGSVGDLKRPTMIREVSSGSIVRG
ncbi:MAG: L-threonylcarbamoyladenylate synthase [Gammaproteobacteria bacterium]